MYFLNIGMMHGVIYIQTKGFSNLWTICFAFHFLQNKIINSVLGESNHKTSNHLMIKK